MKKIRSKTLILIFLGAILIAYVSEIIRFKYFSNVPNVILITIDALRFDHLGCYGYERATSPYIDKLANEGVYFLNCFATSSSTTHATPALFTGRYLEISDFNVLLQSYNNILDKKFVTLAKYLKSFGYYNVAFLNNRHYKIGTGFEQGFNDYKDYLGNAEDITTQVISFLNNYSGKKPFFIWIHYIDPHTPYSPPAEYFKIFENDKLYKENDKILKLHPDDGSPLNMSNGYIPRTAFHKEKYSFNYYVAWYDAEVLYTDFHIGRLLENIKDDNILFILSADHGESLGEHNTYFHHENMYDEVLHIPLIIKDNRYFKGGNKITKVVSSVDIVPTILNRVNPIWYFFHKNRFDGKDLEKIITNIKDSRRKYIYSYFPGIRVIRDINKNVKYILHNNGKELLFFLPDENNNHINDNSLKITPLRRELRKQLETWTKNYPIRCDLNSHKISLDEETKENLKSLGYLQ